LSRKTITRFTKNSIWRSWWVKEQLTTI